MLSLTTDSYFILPSDLADRVKGDSIEAVNARAILSTMNLSSKNGHHTMRQWFANHAGEKVNLVQVSSTVWAPMGRTVDSARATFATLGGSRVDFAGRKVIYSDDDTLIVTFTFGRPSYAVYFTCN